MRARGGRAEGVLPEDLAAAMRRRRAAARGTSTRSTVALLAAAGTNHRTRTTTTDFDWPEDSSSLTLFPYTILPFARSALIHGRDRCVRCEIPGRT